MDSATKEISYSTTFKVADVPVEVVDRYEEEDSTTNEGASKQSICSKLLAFNTNHCSEVLMETPFSPGVRASPKNGFVKTVIECYNEHHNLVIRPDDIWTAILTQFSFYINKSAEKFRKQFVNFEGQKVLEVTLRGSLRSAAYDIFVEKVAEKIHENLVDDTVKDWILPNFTTTTRNDFISCGVVFMATMKKYFLFRLRLMCGIPNITLEGTVGDWENIRNRLEKLKDYKLDKWYELLKQILDQFIQAKKGNVDLDFWNRICYHKGRKSGRRYICGWLTAFAIFNEEGKFTDYEKGKWPQIDMKTIPFGFVNVNVQINDGDGTHESIMFAGHIANEILEDGVTLKPQIGWGIALKMKAKDVEVFHKAARAKKKYRCPDCSADLMNSDGDDGKDDDEEEEEEKESL